MAQRHGDLNSAYEDLVTKARAICLLAIKTNEGNGDAQRKIPPLIEALDSAYLAFRGHSIQLAK